MKILLLGIGMGIGFFGTCLIVGSRIFDSYDFGFIGVDE